MPAALVTAATCFGQTCGTWTMNPALSTFSGGVQPTSLAIRIEPHPKGEVFTVDRTEPDGRTTSSSTVLYFDGAARAFQGFECSGTRSSRRTDVRTVEILRQCTSGDWERVVRRLTQRGKELIVEITRQRSGRRSEERLVLEKQ